MEISQRKHNLIHDCLSSMDRIEHLQDELEATEARCSAALKLSQKFRELELLETRFSNVRTRRRQFQNQVESHLKGIGTEIEREARMRTQNAREYYDEQYLKEHSRRHVDPENDEQQQFQETSQNENGEGGECARCPIFESEIERLKNVRRAKWVDRAVRILCTQAVNNVNNNNHPNAHHHHHEVPTHRILALVGSDKTTKRPAVLRPLFSRRITKPTPGEEERRLRDKKTAATQMMTFDVPASLVVTMKHQQQRGDGGEDARAGGEEEEDQEELEAVARAKLGCAATVEWKIPSANDHSKHWKVRLNVQ